MPKSEQERERQRKELHSLGPDMKAVSWYCREYGKWFAKGEASSVCHDKAMKKARKL